MGCSGDLVSLEACCLACPGTAAHVGSAGSDLLYQEIGLNDLQTSLLTTVISGEAGSPWLG